MNTHTARPRTLGRILLGLLLALALSRAAAAQDVESGRPQQVEPAGTPDPDAASRMTRLAPPPTVAAPTQADDGAQLYWLHCQPCHGDQGQGLTDEWRAQYPPEDQYCWESGCHGERPYDSGFTLPFTIPAVIGDGTLTKYQTVGGLYHYIQVAMPYWNPASLTDDEYLAITAFLARAHGVWDGAPLTADRVDAMLLPAGLAARSATTSGAATATPAVTSPTTTGPSGTLIAGGLAIALLTLIAGIWLWQRSAR